jgi:hypothetical protein
VASYVERANQANWVMKPERYHGFEARYLNVLVGNAQAAREDEWSGAAFTTIMMEKYRSGGDDWQLPHQLAQDMERVLRPHSITWPPPDPD